MPFNLGGLSSGLVDGYDVGQSWRKNSAQDKSQEVWGKTLASLGISDPAQPTPQPQPPGPPGAPSASASGAFSPWSGGVSGFPMSVKIPGSQPMGPPPPPQMPQTAAPPQQSFPPPQQGASNVGGPQGMYSLGDVVSQIRKANPNLDPSKPEDARAIAAAAGNALPFMRQQDQETYRRLMADMQQQRVDLSERQGDQRLDIQQQRADTARDQGWARIQQSSEKMMQSLKARQDNLALNQSRLEEAKKKGDLSSARLIETQMRNDRLAKTQLVNSVSLMLRSATPAQLKDPAYKADIDFLHQQIADLKDDPMPQRGPIASQGGPAPDPSKPRLEDAPTPKPEQSGGKRFFKNGDVVNGYRYQGPDAYEGDKAVGTAGNWVPADRPSPPMAGQND